MPKTAWNPDRKTSNLHFVGGQHTTVAAADTVDTGLNTVVRAGASLEDDPVLTADRVTCAPATAGNITVKTWMPTGTTNTTPIAATTFGKKVQWWALGY